MVCSVKDPLMSLNKILDEVVPKSDIIILLFSSNDLDINRLKTKDLTMIIRSRNKQSSFRWRVQGYLHIL